jgi:VWFA-related protein
VPLRCWLIFFLTIGCQAAQNPTIRTTVPLVQVPVQVTDRSRHPVAGLTAEDFQLIDSGAPRPVTVDTIDSGLPPISLAVLVDTSDRSRSVLGKIRKMGALLTEAVAANQGRLALLTYDSEVKVLVDFSRPTSEFVRECKALKASDEMQAKQSEAVAEALKLQDQTERSSRFTVLVIGESRDRGSKLDSNELQRRLQQSGATLYGLSYSSYLAPFTVKPEEYEPSSGGPIAALQDLARLSKPNTMALFSAASGGTTGSFETKGRLESQLMHLADDLHNRYLLSFRPDQVGPAAFHPLSVAVKNHPDYQVRLRAGYWTSN